MSNPGSNVRALISGLQRYQSAVGLGLLLIVAFFVAPRNHVAGNLFGSVFFSVANLRNVLNQLAVPGLLALGATFVIVSGGIDLSAGSALGLLNCVCATWIVHGHSTPQTCGFVLGLGTLIGASIGFVVHASKLQPFIVTLAAMVTLRALAFVYTNEANISGLSHTLDWFEQPYLAIPAQGWILLGTTLLGALLLRSTVFGRRVYAVGGNLEAARYAGVPIGRVRVACFAINGFCIALAAILFTSRTTNGTASAGTGYELDAITAAVVGGSALTGGAGSAIGAFMGALFIVCLNVLLILEGVSYYVGQGWKGIIILLAVYLQNIGKRTS